MEEKTDTIGQGRVWDVLLAAISTRQVLVTALSVIAIIIAGKLSGSDLVAIFRGVYHIIRSDASLGYVIAVFTAIGWVLHVSFLKKCIS